MSLWASSDLLSKCKFLARRPSTDNSVSDAQWYTLLTDAQAKVYDDLFPVVPELRYGAPTLMTASADGGKTYAFGVDAETDALYPFGHAEIYARLSDIPDYPMAPGVDFIPEGTKIRIPQNRTKSFVDGAPYYRMALRPDTVISASVQPLLQPKSARMLLVWGSLEMYAMRPGSGADPNYFAMKYSKDLDRIITSLRTAYNSQGSPPDASARMWWLTD